jgi:hypothetical protein
METFVACKRTNEYCDNATKLTNKDVLHNIKVKNGHDVFSRMKYAELITYFSNSPILYRMEGIASNYFNPKNLHKIKVYKRLVARHLRYHLRGLSEEQTLHKFGYELAESKGFVSRYSYY